MQQNIKAFALSSVLTLIITIFVYNVPQILDNYTGQEIFWAFPQRTFYLLFSYFFLYNFLQKKLKLKVISTFLISIIPVLLIDASVLITNPLLIPFRFPISSYFSILGSLLGFFYSNGCKQKMIGLFITYLLSTFFLVNVLFPRLLYTVNENPRLYSDTTKKINVNSIQLRKINGEYKTIVELIKYKKILLLDFYFVGCNPCENKREVLEEINKEIKDSLGGVLFICDGAVSTFNQFKNNAKGNENMFYDESGIFIKSLNLQQKMYPYELIIKRNGDILSDFSGFEIESKKIYKNETIKKINAFNDNHFPN